MHTPTVPHTPAEYARWAFFFGHGWNAGARYANLLNLDEGSVVKMNGSEKDAKDLVASWQEMDANVADLVKFIHGRELHPDGDVGPASEAVLNYQRCPLPDHPPPPGATFHYDDPELQRAVEEMQQATGRGSIPVGCYGTANVHEVKVSYDTSRLSSKQKDWFPEIKARHTAEVAAIGLKVIEVAVGQKSNVDFYGRSFAGSTIGMAGFLGTSCGNNVFCTINPSYAPDQEMVLILVMHEHGHNWNCNHRSGFIMNPSIRRVKPKWVERDATGKIVYTDPSYTADLHGFFGGGPLEISPVPLPPPPPPGPGPLIPVAEFDVTAPGHYQIFRRVPTLPPPGDPVPT